MASVDGGPLFEQQQQSGIVYGDTGGMDIKAANLNHLVTLVVSFFGAYMLMYCHVSALLRG